MGRGQFQIVDSQASFGKEKTSKKERVRLHLILSAEAASDLRAAVLEAAGRERASVIECDCRPYKREVLRMRFRWYRKLRWVLQATIDEQPTRFDEEQEDPTLFWNRADLPSLIRICEGLERGDADYAVHVGDSLSVWLWGSVLP